MVSDILTVDDNYNDKLSTLLKDLKELRFKVQAFEF
jgi:hypothetical protein